MKQHISVQLELDKGFGIKIRSVYQHNNQLIVLCELKHKSANVFNSEPSRSISYNDIDVNTNASQVLFLTCYLVMNTKNTKIKSENEAKELCEYFVINKGREDTNFIAIKNEGEIRELKNKDTKCLYFSGNSNANNPSAQNLPFFSVPKEAMTKNVMPNDLVSKDVVSKGAKVEGPRPEDTDVKITFCAPDTDSSTSSDTDTESESEIKSCRLF
jgi:hypothetical protein